MNDFVSILILKYKYIISIHVVLKFKTKFKNASYLVYV